MFFTIKVIKTICYMQLYFIILLFLYLIFYRKMCNNALTYVTNLLYFSRILYNKIFFFRHLNIKRVKRFETQKSNIYIFILQTFVYFFGFIILQSNLLSLVLDIHPTASKTISKLA